MSSLGFASVSVRYGRRDAIHSFDAQVRPGEWLCLIGPNGAGKSSLLRAVAGLAEHRGEIRIDGTSLDHRSARRRAELVAYVPQSPVLPGDMTGAEYVLLGRNPYISYFGRESAQDRSLVAELLERLRHPNLPVVADRFEYQGRPTMVMEFVPGQTLEDRIRDTNAPLLEQQVLGYGIQVARLAGLPADVIGRAKEILGNLEEGELDPAGQPKLAQRHGRKMVRENPDQLSLFGG